MLQASADYKTDLCAVAERLESETGCNCFILTDPSYSSCCIDVISALHVQATLAIFFGKSCRSNDETSFEVIYIENDGEPRNVHDDVISRVQRIIPREKIRTSLILIDECSKVYISDPSALVVKVSSWSSFCRTFDVTTCEHQTIVYAGDSNEFLVNLYMYFRSREIVHVSMSNDEVARIDPHFVNKALSKRYIPSTINFLNS